MDVTKELKLTYKFEWEEKCHPRSRDDWNKSFNTMLEIMDDWIDREGPEKATRGWMGANQNSSRELDLYTKSDTMHLSSYSTKTT
jgi:hypothetical protein